MAKYVLTNKAVADLSEIWEYTFKAWSETRADKYYQLLIETFRAIAERPEKGKTYDEISFELLGYRVGRDIIFYRGSKGGIEVIRILHERMDLRKKIEE